MGPKNVTAVSYSHELIEINWTINSIQYTLDQTYLGTFMADLTNLPRCHHEDFKLWNEKRKLVGGWLKKKAGGRDDKTFASMFNKGSWQKRWFVIEDEITGQENYELSYYHTPDDRKPRQVYPLQNASIVFSGGEAFQITLDDGTTIHLACERDDIKEKWYETLVRVIEIASARDKAIKQRIHATERGVDPSEAHSRSIQVTESDDYVGLDVIHPNRRFNLDDDEAPASPKKSKQRASPSLRLDIDIQTIPPSSMQRRQFEEMFVSDVAQSLTITEELLEIYSVKPAANMPWLVVVEFDIYLPPTDISHAQVADDDDDFDIEDMNYQAELERMTKQQDLLRSLHEMVLDTTSVLYNGYVTCKLDPSYSQNLVDLEDTDEIFSSDARIMSVMNRYKDVYLPNDHEDKSHFVVTLSFENVEYPLLVPDITYMRQRHAFVWPFEIKQSLGILGTMQEHWVEPTALVPKNVARNLSHPVRFEPSVRVGGQVCINAARLIPGALYEVECADLRTEVLMNLTNDEILEINNTFRQYDLNGDGNVAKSEIDKLVRARTKERRDIIEQKFQEFLNEPGVSDAEIQQAEENKRQHMQACTEAQIRLLKMFESSDTNGDGQLSLTEFMLAESWWLRCTLNPSHAHLF